MRLSIIVAMDVNGLIGKDNDLPWRLPADLKYFKKITTGKTVLMGRKTYSSIGKPLPNRRNIVISRNSSFIAPGCEIVGSISEAIELTINDTEVIIMGGSSFYEQMLPMVDILYITEIEGEFEGDSYFPNYNREDFLEVSRDSRLSDEQNPYNYHFTVLKRQRAS